MKKLVAMILAFLMVFSLTACGGIEISLKGNKGNEEVIEEREERVEEIEKDWESRLDGEDEKEDKEEKEDEDLADKEERKDKEDRGKKEDKKEDEKEYEYVDMFGEDEEERDNSSASIKNAIDQKDTFDTRPAKFGEWVKTRIYSTETNEYEIAYVRLTDIYMESEDKERVEKYISLHNKYSDYKQIDVEDLKLPSDVEIGIVEYEIYLPEDFEASEFMGKPTLSLYAHNIGGGGFPAKDSDSVYIGLGSNSVALEDTDYDNREYAKAGRTYTNRILFTMVEDYTDYSFEFTSYSGSKSDVEDLVYCYLGIE